jgi:uncharacterized cofD-like protein
MNRSRRRQNDVSSDLTTDTNSTALTTTLRKLLPLGLGVKRWLVIGSVGVFISATGMAYVLGRVFDLRPPSFLPIAVEAIILIAVGVVVLLLSVYGLLRSLGPQMFASRDVGHLLENIGSRRTRERGPKIVVVGGGTGLSVLLRGIKQHTDNITAVVTVADDGGSSGRLRREMGVPPPGDFRNCIVALSDSEKLVTDLFQYRFSQGEGLEGHNFGNLFIVAMVEVTGSFDKALSEAGKVLAVRGQIVPATVANVRLSARLTDGRVVTGESNIPLSGAGIEELFLEPRSPAAHPQAVQAILDADIVVMGPGSLFTSILPNLLVPGITKALEESQATKVYVCNVATQEGETDNFSVADHVDALQRHTHEKITDFVIANSNATDPGIDYGETLVVDDGRDVPYATVLHAEIADPEHPVRHSSEGLARAVMSLYHGNRRLRTQQQRQGSKGSLAG